MSPSILIISWCAILIFAPCLTVTVVQAQYGYYTIVAPGTVRSNSFYHISVSLGNFKEPCQFVISISCSDDDEYSTIVNVEPGTTTLAKIWIPRLYSNKGLLLANGIRGIITRERSLLNVEAYPYSVFLQTDKSKYRPGEILQFRVICVDRLTRPVNVGNDVDVEIFDGDENLIKAFPRIKVIQGVFKGSIQISEYPVLGEWKIGVNSNGFSVAQKRFQVARYVLPNFAIQVNTRNDIALDDGQIELTVIANYTYGEPVDGNMTLHVWSSYSAIEENHWMTTKSIQINGSASVVLDLNNDLGISTETDKQTFILLYKLAVDIVVRDYLTNQTSSSLENINIYSYPFKVSIDAPKYFEVGKPVKIKVSVRDLMHNPVHDRDNPVSLIVESVQNDPLTYSLYLNKNGNNVVTLNLKNDNVSSLRFRATYRGCRSQEEVIRRLYITAFTLTTLTDSPQVGKELVIQLKSIDPIQYFVYELVSRGDIIETKRIEVPGNETTYSLRLNTTHEMIPKTTLFVHRVLNGVFDSKLKDIHIKRAFRNSINLSSVEEAHPGDLVSIAVTTDPISYVGLMGVDHKLLIDPNYKEDLTEDNIFTALRNYDSINMDSEVYPGREAGLITFSNTNNRKGDGIGSAISYVLSGASMPQPLPRAFDKPSIELPYVRKMFSESWLFTDIQSTPDREFTITEKVPDTITSWAISGFSLNPTSGITLTKNSTNVKVFQEFFISVELPYAIKEGEILEVPILVFNYMKQALAVDVTLENFKGELEIYDSPMTRSDIQKKKTIPKNIPSGGGEKLSFFVKIVRVGLHNVTIKAISPWASDAIQKTLNVEATGIPRSVSKTYLVHFLNDSKQEDEIHIDIPDNCVPNSEVTHLSIVGDIFGPLMRSLEKTARVPYGNARENMDKFMSNLLVLKYLKTLNRTNPVLEDKARLYLELGYQNQLAFKQLDGSFSLVTQPKQRTGDLGLTVYTLWGFEEAAQYISSDYDRIQRGLEYIASKQDQNGSFKVSESIEENIALTSFAVLLLTSNTSHAHKYRKNLDKALEYLFEALDDLEDLESIAMPAYALAVGGHNKSTEILNKFSSSNNLTSKAVMWTKPDSLESCMETTAAAFLSLLKPQDKEQQNLLPVITALTLVGQNDKTPVHIIALKALIDFAKEINVGRKDLIIHFDDGRGISGDHHINSQNAQVLDTIQLNRDSRKIRLLTEGTGFAIANVIYKYNLPPVNQTSSGYQAHISISKSNDVLMVLEICLSIKSRDNPHTLTKVEVNLQSGYTTNENAFDDILQSNKLVQVIRLNGRDDSVLMYFNDIPENGTCLELIAWKTFSVFKAMPASVVVYDALGNGQQSVSFYSKYQKPK